MGPKRRRARKNLVDDRPFADSITPDGGSGLIENLEMEVPSEQETIAQISPAIISDKKLNSAVLVLKNCMSPAAQYSIRTSPCSAPICAEMSFQGMERTREAKTESIPNGYVPDEGDSSSLIKGKAFGISESGNIPDLEAIPALKQKSVMKRNRKDSFRRISRQRTSVCLTEAAEISQDTLVVPSAASRSSVALENSSLLSESDFLNSLSKGSEVVFNSEVLHEDVFTKKRKKKKEKQASKKRKLDNGGQEEEAMWMVSPSSGDEERMIIKRQKKMQPLPDCEMAAPDVSSPTTVVVGLSEANVATSINGPHIQPFDHENQDSSYISSRDAVAGINMEPSNAVQLMGIVTDMAPVNAGATPSKGQKRGRPRKKVKISQDDCKGDALSLATTSTNAAAFDNSTAITDAATGAEEVKRRYTRRNLKLCESRKNQELTSSTSSAPLRVTRSRQSGNSRVKKTLTVANILNSSGIENEQQTTEKVQVSSDSKTVCSTEHNSVIENIGFVKEKIFPSSDFVEHLKVEHCIVTEMKADEVEEELLRADESQNSGTAEGKLLGFPFAANQSLQSAEIRITPESKTVLSHTTGQVFSSDTVTSKDGPSNVVRCEPNAGMKEEEIVLGQFIKDTQEAKDTSVMRIEVEISEHVFHRQNSDPVDPISCKGLPKGIDCTLELSEGSLKETRAVPEQKVQKQNYCMTANDMHGEVINLKDKTDEPEVSAKTASHECFNAVCDKLCETSVLSSQDKNCSMQDGNMKSLHIHNLNMMEIEHCNQQFHCSEALSSSLRSSTDIAQTKNENFEISAMPSTCVSYSSDSQPLLKDDSDSSTFCSDVKASCIFSTPSSDVSLFCRGNRGSSCMDINYDHGGIRQHSIDGRNAMSEMTISDGKVNLAKIMKPLKTTVLPATVQCQQELVDNNSDHLIMKEEAVVKESRIEEEKQAELTYDSGSGRTETAAAAAVANSASAGSTADCSPEISKPTDSLGNGGEETGYIPLKKRRLRIADPSENEKVVSVDVTCSATFESESDISTANKMTVHDSGASAELLTSVLQNVNLMPKANKFVGAHIPTTVSGGLANAVIHASHMGAFAFGIFIKAQKIWNPDPLDPLEATKFREALKEKGYRPHMVVPHGSYLMNCGASDAEVLRKSRESLVDDLKRCQLLGLPIFNFHPGSYCNPDTADDCIIRVAESINYAHGLVDKIVTVIENTSGQLNTIGSSFSELKQIIDKVTDKSRIGICLDTCHAFAAGFDLCSEAGYRKMMQDFHSTIGLQYLKAVHINDSRDDLGSHMDHHESIGKGKIGLTCFQLLMADRSLENIPLILETPISRHRDEIELLYSFVS